MIPPDQGDATIHDADTQPGPGYHPHLEQTHNATLARRVELLLGRVETLPTLSPVAVTVLEASADPDADIKHIADLIGTDPALSARILRMCRLVGRATREPITTVERAVVMLGLDAVRSLMLSVEISGVLNQVSDEQDGSTNNNEQPFDRDGFWQHSVASACAAEIIAESAADTQLNVLPAEAFLAGLLHDLGKLVLDRIVPKAFARSVALAAARREDLIDVERAVIGLDHHTAGKRLAEHWGLPHALQDVMWLQGQPAELMPELPHGRLISIVTIARAVCVAAGIGTSGESPSSVTPSAVCQEHGLDPAVLNGLEDTVVQRLQERLDMLGFNAHRDDESLLASVATANRALGEINQELRTRAELADARGAALDEARRFLASAGTSGAPTGLVPAMGRVCVSAQRLLNTAHATILWRARTTDPFIRARFDERGDLAESGDAGTPSSERWLAELREGGSRSAFDAETLAWLADQTMGDIPPTRLSVALLPTPEGPTGLLLYEDDGTPKPAIEGSTGMWTLTAVWGAALAAAAQHEGAKRLSERLADSNRRLARAQRELVEARSMARLGEMTAGAAHEMNNPLAVLCGHAELLLENVRNADARRSTKAILDAANRISDLVSDLHLFAIPRDPKPERVETDELLRDSLDRAHDRYPGGAASRPQVRIDRDANAASVFADAVHIGDALTELIVNALEASQRGSVHIHAGPDATGDRVLITVTDDGPGISDHAIKHAFDPFFSEKPAGRQTGMGLARAGRLAWLNGGEITLRRNPGGGTQARLELNRSEATTKRNTPTKRAA